MRSMLFSIMTLLLLCSNIYSDKPKITYEYAPSTDRWVCIKRTGKMIHGKLDEDGVFIPKLTFDADAPLSAGVPASSMVMNEDQDVDVAYQFMSNCLIKGNIKRCKFTPLPGEKVILFSDYNYNPASIPIWNLPGTFKVKGEKLTEYEKFVLPTKK